MEQPAVVTEQRAPWWRTALWWALCVLASLTTLAYALPDPAYGWQMLVVLAGFAVAFALPTLLAWRHRHPYTVTLVASGAAVLLPVGGWTALVALGSLLGRRRGREVWWAAGAAAAATAVSVVRDVRNSFTGMSLIGVVLAPADAGPQAQVPVSWWTVPVCVALGMSVAVGAGLLVRARREAAASAHQVTVAQRATTQLGDQLARQRERARIGREVHDVLGHRLSLLNLHAGALEAHAPPDGPLADSARLVRESAAKSMADLRSLLGMLNEPLDTDPAEPDLSLVDLPAMIAETVDTGVPVSSSVYVDSAEQADPALARAVYRIVQELLTNARRHAPDRPIRLDVSGGPATGMRIDARNPYVPGSGSPGGGQGLRGVAERVELLGGRLAYGLDDEGRTFRVTVDLPWHGPGG